MRKELPALKAEIGKLLKERNAILLAHNYQRDEVQEIADITGDSLGLSQEAATDDGGRHRLLRRPFHGGERRDPLPGKDRPAAARGRGLPDGGHDHRVRPRGVPGSASRRRRCDVRQLLRGGEGPLRRLLHLGQRGERGEVDPGGERDLHGPRPEPRAMGGEGVGPPAHVVGRLLPDPRAADRRCRGEGEGGPPRRRARRPPRMPAGGGGDGGCGSLNGGNVRLVPALHRRRSSSSARRWESSTASGRRIPGNGSTSPRAPSCART